MRWQQNRVRARTVTTEPTKADQSQAAETDINVIVGRMLPSGTVPGHGGTPIYADWTTVPTDLAGLFEQARAMERHRKNLPKELQQISIEELLTLTPQQLQAKLTPQPTTPATPPAGDGK